MSDIRGYDLATVEGLYERIERLQARVELLQEVYDALIEAKVEFIGTRADRLNAAIIAATEQGEGDE